MKFNNRQNKPYNTENGVIWASRSVAVTGVVFVKLINKNEIYILLTKRSMSMEDEAGKWCIPCGYLDWDETIAEATNREIYEETGFSVELYKDILTFEVPMFNIDDNPNSSIRQNISFSSLKIYEKVNELPLILSSTNESDANKWVSISNLDNYILAFNHITIIKKALTYL